MSYTFSLYLMWTYILRYIINCLIIFFYELPSLKIPESTDGNSPQIVNGHLVTLINLNILLYILIEPSRLYILIEPSRLTTEVFYESSSLHTGNSLEPCDLVLRANSYERHLKIYIRHRKGDP